MDKVNRYQNRPAAEKLAYLYGAKESLTRYKTYLDNEIRKNNKIFNELKSQNSKNGHAYCFNGGYKKALDMAKLKATKHIQLLQGKIDKLENE